MFFILLFSNTECRHKAVHTEIIIFIKIILYVFKIYNYKYIVHISEKYNDKESQNTCKDKKKIEAKFYRQVEAKFQNVHI